MAWQDFQKAFYDKVWGPILQVAAEIGVDPRIIFAQAALESNWGRSKLSTDANNYFGIKARPGQDSVSMRTREVIGGVSQTVTAKFAKFTDIVDSIRGYGDFITRNPRYRNFIGAGDLEGGLTALQASGYATDPLYSSKLRQVINNMPGEAMDFLQGLASAPGPNPIRGMFGVNRVIGETATSIGEAVAGPFDWVKGLFSLNTGVRFIAVIVGLAFIIIAITALLMTSDTVQSVAKTAVKAAV